MKKDYLFLMTLLMAESAWSSAVNCPNFVLSCPSTTPPVQFNSKESQLNAYTYSFKCNISPNQILFTGGVYEGKDGGFMIDYSHNIWTIQGHGNYPSYDTNAACSISFPN